MPTLAKNVSHEYDPSIVFHTHSANIPLLHTWIDDLVRLTEQGLPMDVNPNTDQLVQAMQRYDAIFREILRQMAIFSEPVTKMTAKAWAGSIKLIDYIIKSYHRYVKHTTHLQAQAQLLLNERQASAAASKVRDDEFELERTTLRARIRVLEAETEALKTSNRMVERENKHFRSIISTYIKADDLTEEMWSLFNDYAPAVDEDEIQFNMVEATRGDTVDIAKLSLRNINKLDVEMGELQTLILKEADRQRLLVGDLYRLMERSKEVFGEGRWTSASKYVAGESKSVVQVAEKEVQVDEKDTYGVVEDGKNDHFEEAGVSPPLVPAGMKVRGHNVPYPLRSLMKSFVSVLRIPPATWTYQTIMSIYLHKIRVDKEMDLNNKLRMPMPEFVHYHFRSFFGLQVQADAHVCLFLNACEYHMTNNKRVALFASQLGLYKKDEVASMDVRDTDFILAVLDTCDRITRKREEESRSKQLERFTGKAKGSDGRKEEDFSHLNVNPVLNRSVAIAAATEVLSAWYQDGGQEVVLKVNAMQGAGKQADNNVNIDDFLDIMMEPWTTIRLTWEEHSKFIFSYFCTHYRVIAEAQFANDQGMRDRETILAQASTKLGPTEVYRRPVRLFTKTIAEFEKESLKEDPDAKKKSGGASAPVREPVCELLNKKAYTQAIKLILPLITEYEIDIYWRECMEIASKNVNRILQTIWLRMLDDGSHTISSTATKSAAKKKGKGKDNFEDFYQEKSIGNLNTVQASVRKATFKDFYINLKTGVTQWTLPYKLNTFSNCDIEVEAFVSQLLQRDVFSRSPLVHMMHLNPKDLWPNADILYKQILAQEEKAKKLIVDAELPVKFEEAQLIIAADVKESPIQEVKEEAPLVEKKKKKGSGKKGKKGTASTGKLGKTKGSVKDDLKAGGSNSRPATSDSGPIGATVDMEGDANGDDDYLDDDEDDDFN
jgi:hypothetical protein